MFSLHTPWVMQPPHLEEVAEVGVDGHLRRALLAGAVQDAGASGQQELPCAMPRHQVNRQWGREGKGGAAGTVLLLHTQRKLAVLAVCTGCGSHNAQCDAVLAQLRLP